MSQRQVPINNNNMPKQRAEIPLPDDDEVLGTAVKQMQQQMQRGNIPIMEDLGSESGSEDGKVAGALRRTKRDSRAAPQQGIAVY
jgi:hypothetical protein